MLLSCTVYYNVVYYGSWLAGMLLSHCDPITGTKWAEEPWLISSTCSTQIEMPLRLNLLINSAWKTLVTEHSRFYKDCHKQYPSMGAFLYLHGRKFIIIYETPLMSRQWRFTLLHRIKCTKILWKIKYMYLFISFVMKASVVLSRVASLTQNAVHFAFTAHIWKVSFSL